MLSLNEILIQVSRQKKGVNIKLKLCFSAYVWCNTNPQLESFSVCSRLLVDTVSVLMASLYKN